MKNIPILFLFIVGTMAANAQVKTDSLKKGLSTNKAILNKGVVVQQQTTVPNLTPPKKITQTATAIIQSPSAPTQANSTINPTTQPVVLPDIIITNISFTPNTVNTYFVNYTLKNIGTTSVKKGLLGVQSYINGSASGGGVSISLGTEVNQLLNPGETLSSRNTFGTASIIPGTAYAFELCVNGVKINSGTSLETWGGQQFSELNFTNNSMQSTFTIPPPPPAPADLEVKITSITKCPQDTLSSVRIYYTLKNIGETAIPQTASLSIQGRVEDTDNNPATFLATACCGRPIGGIPITSDQIPFVPGDIKQLYFDANIGAGYYPALVKNTLYQFNIEISNQNSFIEASNANNKNGYNYFLK
ncbi:MAG: hypothetical protein V4541_08145 [Bacteroidota bacterium]